MAFSRHGKQVSFLKGEGPGRGLRIPEKFAREAQLASHSLGPLCCSRCPQFGVSPRKVRDLSALSSKPRPRAPSREAPCAPRPDARPRPPRLRLRAPKPPHWNPGWACRWGRPCRWGRRCGPTGLPPGRGGGGRRTRGRGRSRRPASRTPRPARSRGRRAEQELAQVGQAPAEVSGKLQLPLGAARRAHGGHRRRGSSGGREYRVPAPVRTSAPGPSPHPARPGLERSSAGAAPPGRSAGPSGAAASSHLWRRGPWTHLGGGRGGY